MYTHSTVCPCGKGKITQTSYGDDWNRFKDGPMTIECEECSQKYKVEGVSHHGLNKRFIEWFYPFIYFWVR